MPLYNYIAKSQPYKTTQGTIEAESEQEAINKLTKIGYFPVSINAEDLTLDKKGVLSFSKVSKRDIALFTRQLASLIESGIDMLNGLNIISTQTPNKYLKAVLAEISSKIKDGKPLSESITAYPHIFSNLYAAIIRSGEASGNLDKTLNRLADFLEKDEEFKNSVRSALIYPLFIVIVGILTIIVLLGFVIPRLITMFEDMGQLLPLPTRILINTSSFLRSYWWFILLTILISVFLLRRFYHKPYGKIQLDTLKLKLPVLGEVILKSEISHLTRTLALLFSSGSPVVYSLDISTSVIDNQIIKLELEKFKDRITNGLSFSHCLKDSNLFPAFVTNIIGTATIFLVAIKGTDGAIFHDSLGQLISAADSNNRSLTYAYDAVGNKTKMTTTEAKAVNYSYDSLNRLVSILDTYNKTTTYSYDSLNNLLSLANKTQAIPIPTMSNSF